MGLISRPKPGDTRTDVAVILTVFVARILRWQIKLLKRVLLQSVVGFESHHEQKSAANVAGTTWIDRDGLEQEVSLNDILVITLYNAQVFEIQQRLPGSRVGTVDKFQGQEAPISIYSTATSSYADAPRGMEFLYSLNRLNVATSRARCVSVLVGSPQIFEAECRTPRQIHLANAFCGYLEMARPLGGD